MCRIIEKNPHSVKQIHERRVSKGWEQLPIRRVRTTGKTLPRSGSEFEFMIRVNGQKITAILDTGSPISILPKSYTKTVRPKRIIRNESTWKFVDVNGKPIPILNRYKLNTEMNGIECKTFWWGVETNTKPIIGMDKFDKLGLQLTQRTTKPGSSIRRVTKNRDRQINARKPISKPIHRVENNSDESNQEAFTLEQSINKLRSQLRQKFHQLFQSNHTFKNFEYDVQFKNKMSVKQQKGRRIPIHMQKAVETEIEKLISEGHLEKLEEVGEHIFVSPVVVTRKSDGSVKIALDSVELNKQIVRKTMQMPILADLLDQISMKISEGRGKPLFISTIDLKYAFGQIKLHRNTAKHCVAAIVGGRATGHYRFKKGFYGLADMPVVFQAKIDRVLDNAANAWQDDIIIATRGTPEEHAAELEKVLERLQQHGYRASMEKSKLFQAETEWCGYQINASGVKPKQTRTEAVLKIEPPKTVKEVRSFLGSVQYLANFIENLSAKTEPIRLLLRKETKWRWGEAQSKAFETLKNDIANITALKHYDPSAEMILTTDGSTKGLGATLWQVDEHGRRAVAFASRYLCRAEKNYAINELELLAVKWAIEHFKFYLLGRRFQVETDHKALVAVLGRKSSNREYSSRLTRWRMRLLPFEFDIVYKPGSSMGITDYLSRSPSFEAPAESPDETELIVAIIDEFNKRKNATVLTAAISSLTNERRVNKANVREKSESQTDGRQQKQIAPLGLETPSEIIKRVVENNSEEFQPIRTPESDRRLAILKQAVIKSVDLQNAHQTADSNFSVLNVREIPDSGFPIKKLVCKS